MFLLGVHIQLNPIKISVNQKFDRPKLKLESEFESISFARLKSIFF